MKIRWNRLKLYLLVTLAATAVCGCQTSGKTNPKKQFATLRLHLEASSDGTKSNEPVPIYREKPIMVNIEKTPFLTEGNVAEARVTDAMGGFALHIRFDHSGAALFEEYTASNRGRRIAVHSQFGEKMKDSRWLAAPRISRRVSDGVFDFTPDATRAEADEIALGLNNVARKVQGWIDR